MAFRQQPQQMITVTTTSTTQNAGMWSTDLCDCFSDMDVCCCGMCCMTCLQCQTVGRFGWCSCLPIMDSGVLGIAFRSAMRERYGIQGTPCEDCYMVWFCGMYAWCQMSREVKLRNRL